MMRTKLRYDDQAIRVLEQLGLKDRADQSINFREDVGEGLFILQQLQAIEAQVYRTPFGLLKAEQLIPFQFDVPRGAKEWGYDRVTSFGLAQWISADARDFPTVDVDKERVTFPIAMHGSSFTYTMRDLWAAAMSNAPLESEKAMAARKSIDQHRNRVLLRGDTAMGFSGFINDSTVTQDTVSHGKWDGSAATPDQIIAEFNQIIYLIGTLTRENYWPDTLVVPPLVYSYLTTTPRTSTSDTTIWAYMRENNQYIKNLEMLLELGPDSDTGGTMGGANTGRAIFYKKSPEVVVAKIAVLFEQQPPQQTGMSFSVPCFGLFGGVHWRVPIAGYYLDGVR